MIRHFNGYNQLDQERIFLGYPNRKLICQLNAYHLKIEPRVSGIGSITFGVYKFANGEKNDGYDDIDVGKYIWSDQNGWFRICNIKETADGENPYREITCYDLSIELTQTLLTSFGSMGKEGDEQGGLDRYALYDATDQSHSIAHIFMKKNPNWKFKYIDDAISKSHRSFTNDSINSYGFLTGDVAKAFDCVFIFDGNDRTVSAYKVENLGKKIPQILSYYNLIKEVKISWDEDDIKTVLHVSGGNDATGTALSIASVNPDGNDMISDFSYFYKDMSTELVTKLKEYSQLRENSKGLISTALAQLRILQEALATLNSHEPSSQSSTTWSEYGLVQLKAKAAEYLNNISVASIGNMADPVIKQEYQAYSDLYKAVNDEIAVRITQITAKEAEVTAKKAEASSYVVNMQDILGDELYNELLPFRKEDVLCDDSFIATNAMTDNEILEMKQALYDHGVEQLNRVCKPHFNMTIDSVNFMALFKYKDFIEQLELGDILYIRLDDDNIIETRLLKMEFDWDDLKNFKVTFSSKTNLEDGYFMLEEIRNMTQRNSTTLDYNKTGWSGASQQANSAFSVTQKEFIDLSMQQIVSNGVNQDVVINPSGILIRKYRPEDKSFEPEMAWFTNRQLMLFEQADGTNLREPKVAIGKVYVTKNGVTKSYYGISSEVLYGRLIFGESLIIQNKNNTFTIDENGLVSQSTNGFRVQINPDDPTNILNISKNGTRLFYIDAVTDKLVFKGRAEIDEGYIANWTISQNKLYSGGVGISSDTTAGAIAYWAGNVTPTSAPYWVNNLGKLHTSNIEVTGGTLTVGSNFSVSSAGVLTARSVNITGGYINMGNGLFTASGAGVNFGDYYVSADGTGTLRSSNGLVNITDVFTSGPSGELSRLTIGSDLMYDAVEIRGTGDVNTARVTCRQDCYFEDDWTAGMGALSMFKQIYNRLDAIRYSIQNMGGNVDWD